jgi:hypothetical protein
MPETFSIDMLKMSLPVKRRIRRVSETKYLGHEEGHVTSMDIWGREEKIFPPFLYSFS